MKKNFTLAILVISLMTLPLISISAPPLKQESTPLWTFSPLTPTTISMPTATYTTVEYLVTNQSDRPHTLALTPTPGITQLTSIDTCADNFSLNPQASCTLSLKVDDSAFINGGPVVCQEAGTTTSNTIQCYQPSLNEQLHTQQATGSTIYAVNSLSGSLNWLVKCPIAQSDTLEPCLSVNTSGIVPTNPSALAINAEKTMAYIGNYRGLNEVIRCPINADGSFGSCVNSGNTGEPFVGVDDIILNRDSTRAYVSNYDAGSVSICPILEDGAFGRCVTSSAYGTQGSEAFAFNKDESILYTTTLNNYVRRCTANVDGTLSNCINNLLSGVTASGLIGITINATGNKAYISDFYQRDVYVCEIDSSSGALGSCSASGNSGVAFRPTAVKFNQDETIAYIATYGRWGDYYFPLVQCPVRQNGLFGECTYTQSGSIYPWNGIIFEN